MHARIVQLDPFVNNVADSCWRQLKSDIIDDKVYTSRMRSCPSNAPDCQYYCSYRRAHKVLARRLTDYLTSGFTECLDAGAAT